MAKTKTKTRGSNPLNPWRAQATASIAKTHEGPSAGEAYAARIAAMLPKAPPTRLVLR